MQLRGGSKVCPGRKIPSRKDKSLSILCRLSVTYMESRGIFFADNIKDVCDANGFQIRRAYDILATFKALGLVQGIPNHSASYVWLGVQGFLGRVESLRNCHSVPYKFHTKFTMEMLTTSCLFLLCHRRCKSLKIKHVKRSLREVYLNCSENSTFQRRIYDILNVFSCFPDLIKTL